MNNKPTLCEIGISKITCQNHCIITDKTGLHNIIRFRIILYTLPDINKLVNSFHISNKLISQ